MNLFLNIFNPTSFFFSQIALPNLSGNFILTNTLVLRCIMLLSHSREHENAKKSVSGLFGDSFFYLGKEHLSGQIKYHLRFSLEYLTRESLIGKTSMKQIS